jgi:hypothetical protein
MRFHRTIAALGGSAALTLGSALGLTGAPAGADGPVETFPFEFEFQDVNPCTGEVATVRFTGVERVHEFFNEAGDVHHFNVLSSATIETSDGFFGRETFVTVHNAEGLFGPREEEDRGMVIEIDNATLRNPDTGQRIRVHGASILVYVSEDENVVEKATFVVECLGPAA